MAQLTRRDLLRTAGIAAAGVVLVPARESASAPPPPGSWNHDPASPIGPGHWDDIGFPTCGQSSSQSPVSILTGEVATYRGAPLLMRHESSELIVRNTGHVIEAPIATGAHAALQINGDCYQLVQYHFHAPSEHAVNGQRADVEAHLVHRNAQGGTAVVGVFFRTGLRPNALLDRILLAAPATAGEEVSAGEASPAELFDHIRAIEVEHTAHGQCVRAKSFYAYDGSFTTPGCTEGVRWSVLAYGGGVSNAAVTRAHELIARFPFYDGYPDNNRPLQPLNGRVIRLRRDEKN